MSMRDSIKKQSAQLGYSVGFGARRHFATFEIVDKVPTYFGVITFAFGIIFLKYPNSELSDLIAVLTSIVGGAIVYLNFYSNDKDKYAEIGKKLIKLYNQTFSIYEKAKTCDEVELNNLDLELRAINDELQNIAIHKQVFFSNEFAHFKLFGESQSDWFVDELKLTFWKDKVPAIWRVYFVVFVIVVAILLVLNCDLTLKAIGCIRGG